jgi:predicted  nucleic acid-binding Zn-ribbon protein
MTQTNIIKKCPTCGSKKFRGWGATEVLFDNQDGSLIASEEEKLGIDSEIECLECGDYFRTNQFGEIVTN